MTRIKKTFQNGPVFAGYLCAGHGGVEYSLAAALALIEGGVDLIELGLPYSDLLADGPVIQQAATQALAGGMTPRGTIEMARRLRQRTEVPIILMSYYNPLLRGGAELLQEASAAGVDGVLVVDLPLEEAEPYLAQMRAAALDPIFIATPQTTAARAAQISGHGSGFLYYACRKGTTGVRAGLPEGFVSDVGRLKAQSALPLLAGFGIGDRASARAALEAADGFVVGSAFVKAMAQGATLDQLKAQAQHIDPRSGS